jgi:hypothetical protein
VNFFGRAIENPELIKPYASETQKKVKLTNERLGEIPFYAAHFGIEGLPGVLVESLKEPVEADRLGGETSLLAGK